MSRFRIAGIAIFLAAWGACNTKSSKSDDNPPGTFGAGSAPHPYRLVTLRGEVGDRLIAGPHTFFLDPSTLRPTRWVQLGTREVDQGRLTPALHRTSSGEILKYLLRTQPKPTQTRLVVKNGNNPVDVVIPDDFAKVEDFGDLTLRSEGKILAKGDQWIAATRHDSVVETLELAPRMEVWNKEELIGSAGISFADVLGVKIDQGTTGQTRTITKELGQEARVSPVVTLSGREANDAFYLVSAFIASGVTNSVFKEVRSGDQVQDPVSVRANSPNVAVGIAVNQLPVLSDNSTNGAEPPPLSGVITTAQPTIEFYSPPSVPTNSVRVTATHPQTGNLVTLTSSRVDLLPKGGVHLTSKGTDILKWVAPGEAIAIPIRYTLSDDASQPRVPPSKENCLVVAGIGDQVAESIETQSTPHQFVTIIATLGNANGVFLDASTLTGRKGSPSGLLGKLYELWVTWSEAQQREEFKECLGEIEADEDVPVLMCAEVFIPEASVDNPVPAPFPKPVKNLIKYDRLVGDNRGFCAKKHKCAKSDPADPGSDDCDGPNLELSSRIWHVMVVSYNKKKGWHELVQAKGWGTSEAYDVDEEGNVTDRGVARATYGEEIRLNAEMKRRHKNRNEVDLIFDAVGTIPKRLVPEAFQIRYEYKLHLKADPEKMIVKWRLDGWHTRFPNHAVWLRSKQNVFPMTLIHRYDHGKVGPMEGLAPRDFVRIGPWFGLDPRAVVPEGDYAEPVSVPRMTPEGKRLREDAGFDPSMHEFPFPKK